MTTTLGPLSSFCWVKISSRRDSFSPGITALMMVLITWVAPRHMHKIPRTTLKAPSPVMVDW